MPYNVELVSHHRFPIQNRLILLLLSANDAAQLSCMRGKPRQELENAAINSGVSFALTVDRSYCSNPIRIASDDFSRYNGLFRL
jgi:hypothetical protein